MQEDSFHALQARRLFQTLAAIPSYAGFVPAFVQGNALFSPPRRQPSSAVTAGIGSANSNVTGSWVCDTCGGPSEFSGKWSRAIELRRARREWVTMSVPNPIGLATSFWLETNSLFCRQLDHQPGGSGQKRGWRFNVSRSTVRSVRPGAGKMVPLGTGRNGLAMCPVRTAAMTRKCTPL